MITVNGESRTLEAPVTVTEYLEACNYVPVQVVVELNEEIIKRETYDTTVLRRRRCGNPAVYGRRKLLRQKE